MQRRHNCSPAASFANCVMTLYLLKVHLQTFLSIPITQKCQILSCDILVANELYVLLSFNSVTQRNVLYKNKTKRNIHSEEGGSRRLRNAGREVTSQKITICQISFHGNDLKYLSIKRKGRFCHGVSRAAVTGREDYHHTDAFSSCVNSNRSLMCT